MSERRVLCRWLSLAMTGLFSSALALSCGGSGAGGNGPWSGEDGGYVVLPDPPDAEDAGGASEADASDIPVDLDGGGGPLVPIDAGEAPDPMDAGMPQPVPLMLNTVSPSRGPVSGGVRMSLSGLGFFRSFGASGASAAASQTAVFIGTHQAGTFSIINDLSMEVVAPASESPGVFDVVVVNPSGEARCIGCFTYFVPIALDAVSPASGSMFGGEWVSLSGNGFDDGVRVFFGGRESPAVLLDDESHLRAMTPASPLPGKVAVEAFGTGGLSSLPGAFVYASSPVVSGAVPAAVPLSGGEISIAGSGLTGAQFLIIGGAGGAGGAEGAETVAAASASDTRLTAAIPARETPGCTSLSVAWTSGAAVEVPGGICWAEEVSAEETEGVLLTGVFPQAGPALGGIPVTLFGARLSDVSLVSLGAHRISGSDFLARTDASLTFVLPAGEAGDAPEISLFSDEGADAVFSQSGLFRYGPSLESVSPSQAAAGSSVSILGKGFLEGTEYIVQFGPAASPRVSAQGSGELLAEVPDVRGLLDVRVFPSGFPQAASVIQSAFHTEEALSLSAISPSEGSVAGGESVTLYGTGFVPGVSFRIGDALVRDVEVLDSSHATGRVPTGRAGVSDVTALWGESFVRLSGAYTYKAPPSAIGGSTGASLHGTLSVITSTSSGDILPGVSVVVSLPDRGEILAAGTTDLNGMLTLQSPAMNRPVQVTFRREGFRTLSVGAQASENLAVFLTQIAQLEPSGSGGGAVTSGGAFITAGTSEAGVGEIPSGSTAAGGGTVQPTYTVGGDIAVISGTVTGFKLPRDLGPSEIPMAKVSVAPTSYFSTPPFSASSSEALRDAMGERWRVTSDGGPFTIYGRDGQQTVYAVFGIYDTLTGSFEPSLMGLARGVSSLPSSPASGIDIVLDIHLTGALPIEIQGLSDAPADGSSGGDTALAYAWLALGNDGYIPFGPVQGSSALVLSGLPRLSVGNFLFMAETHAWDGSSLGYCFSRSEGLLSDGLTIGPVAASLAPIPPDDAHSVEQETPDEITGLRYRLYNFDGTIRWSLRSGSAADMLRLFVQVIHGSDGTSELVEVILPGDALSLDLAPLLKSPVDPARDTVVVTYTAVRSPRFDYDFWSYAYFNTSALSCWSQGGFEVVLREPILDADAAEAPSASGGEAAEASP